MPELSRRFLLQLALVHIVFAALLNLPAFTGNVPLPAGIVNWFAPWVAVTEAVVRPVDDRGLDDLITQIYPWRVFAARTLRSGELPQWNPHVLGGTPFLANAQSALFYPLNWLYIVLPVPIGWTLLLIAKTALAGFFASLLARTLGAHAVGAICGGIVFTTSGFITGWRGYPMGDAALWLPAALLAVIAVAGKQNAKSVVFAAVTFAMPVLAGHPETAAHIAAFILAMAVFQGFEMTGQADRRRRFAALLSCAIALSLGIAAVQMLPTLEWLNYTAINLDLRWPPKPATEVFGLFSRDFRINPNNIGLPIPESAVYAGVMPLLLAALAVAAPHRRNALFLAGMGAAAAFVVYGVEPFHWLSTKTPLLAGLKNGRLLLVVDFSLAMLAAIGLTRLSERPLSRGHVIALLVTSAVCGWGIWNVHRLEGADVPFWRSAIFTGALLVSGMAMILLRALGRFTPRMASAGVLLIVVCDSASAVTPYIPYVPLASVYPPAPIFDFLKSRVEPWQRIGIVDDAIPVNAVIMYGLRSLDGYEIELMTSDRMFYDLAGDFTGTALHTQYLEQTNDQRLNMMAVKYFVAGTTHESFRRFAERSGYVSLASFGLLEVFENPSALEGAVLVPAANIETLAFEDLQTKRLRDPDFDPHTSVLMRRAPGQYAPGRGTATRTGILSLEVTLPQRARLQVEALEPAILMLSEMNYPGWKVTVNGQQQPLLETNYGLMGVALGPGAHDVVFEYSSTTLAAAIAVTLLAMLVCVLLWITHARPMRYGQAAAAGFIVLTALLLALSVVQQPLRADPESLELSRQEVVAGKDSYIMRVSALPNMVIDVRYRIDDGPVREFSARLNSRGEIRFDVSMETEKGLYHFLAFRRSGESRWVEAEGPDAVLSVK